MIRFRFATTDDVPKIAPLETAAGEMFREVDMEAIANDPPLPEAVLMQAVEDNLLWVATEFGSVRAYLLAEMLPESLHIEQMSVDPEAAHRGIGARLLESVCADDRAIERGKISLISFENVPWNAPYYERLGFLDIEESEWPAGIGDKIAAERERGLHAWPRVVMIREVHAPEHDESDQAEA